MDLEKAENLKLTGFEYYKKGNFKEAVKIFKLAVQAYQAKFEPDHAAEMANNLCVAYLQLNEYEKAYHAVVGTEKIFAEHGKQKLQAMAIGNIAKCLESLKRYEEAETAYRECANLLMSLGEDHLLADIKKAQSAMLLRQGRSLEALSEMQAGLSQIKRPGLKQKLLKKLINFPSKLIKGP